MDNDDGTTSSTTVLCVNVTLKDYQDMITEYSFSAEQIELINEMMSPENLAMLGYTGGGGGGGNSVSSMTQDGIDAILSGISDSTQKSVVGFALSKVGYPYSQDLMLTGEKENRTPIYQEFLDKKQEFLERQKAQSTVSGNRTDAENVDVSSDIQKYNFHYNLWEVEKGGPKTRYQWNVDAIRTLKTIESENRLATPEEQKILSKYVGWGGLQQVFDDYYKDWKNEFAELKSLLTEEEYTAARATVNNAFYTAPEVASCISQALVQFGFRGGNVLEPSMGIGNFFGTIPAQLQSSNLYGVEIDSISGRIVDFREQVIIAPYLPEGDEK